MRRPKFQILIQPIDKLDKQWGRLRITIAQVNRRHRKGFMGGPYRRRPKHFIVSEEFFEDKFDSNPQYEIHEAVSPPVHGEAFIVWPWRPKRFLT